MNVTPGAISRAIGALEDEGVVKKQSEGRSNQIIYIGEESFDEPDLDLDKIGLYQGVFEGIANFKEIQSEIEEKETEWKESEKQILDEWSTISEDLIYSLFEGFQEETRQEYRNEDREDIDSSNHRLVEFESIEKNVLSSSRKVLGLMNRVSSAEYAEVQYDEENLVENLKTTLRELEKEEDMIQINTQRHMINSDYAEVLLRTAEGQGISEIEEKTGMDSAEILEYKRNMKPFFVDKGKYSVDYEINTLGQEIFGQLIEHKEDILDSMTDGREMEESEDEIPAEPLKDKSYNEKEFVNLLRNSNDNQMTQSELSEKADMDEDEVKQFIGGLRDSGYDVRRYFDEEEDTFNVKYNGKKDKIINSPSEDLTGPSLWTKVTNGAVSGDELSAEKLVRNGRYDEDKGEIVSSVLRKNNGEMGYKELAKELQSERTILPGLAYLGSEGDIEFKEDKVVAPEFQESQVGWNDIV